MADLSPQELQALFEKFRSGAELTTEELRKLGMGTQAFGESLEKAGVSLGRGMAGFVGNMAKGEVSFKALNPVVDGVVGALGEMAKTLPFAGNAIAGSLKLAAEGAKFLLDQLESTTKSFQEISRVGALTSTGMTGLRRQFERSGQTLQGWQKTVQANAETLARFGGTAGAGAEKFSSIVGELTLGPLTQDLRRIGFTADDISEAAAGFVQQQTRLGQAQTKSQAQLVAGSKEYAENLDVLAKLTGQSRAELQKQQDAALSEARFRASTELMIAQGNEKGAKAMLNFQSRFAKIAPGISQGIRDSLTNANSEAAKQLFQSTGGASREIIERLKAGIITEDQATSELQDALKATSKQALVYAANVGEGAKKFVNIAEQQDVVNATMKDGVLQAKKTQKDQQKKTDPMTAAAVNAQVAMEQMNRQINMLATELLPAASTAVATFTNVMNKGMQEIGKALGIDLPELGSGAAGGGGSASGGGGGARNTATGERIQTGAGNLNAAGGANKNEHGVYQQRGGRYGTSASGGTAGFRYDKEAGGLQGILGSVENIVTGGRGFRAAYGQGVPDVINFGGDSGSRKHFDQLNDTVREAFINMAVEYNQLTGGKKLNVNSAFRSREEQANVKSNGRPKAAPGTSLHEKGLALDINTADVALLKQHGLLDKYKFLNDIAGDAPHIYMRPPNKEGPSLPEYAAGGIASGPKSGYQALLHGMEAIVPLANNRSIPVSFRDAKAPDLGSAAFGQELPMINEAMNRQSDMLQKQLEKSEAMIQALNRFASGEQMQTMISKLDTLGDKMSTSNDINTKLLQVSM